ncbi:MAG: nucleotidyl transferase AbiEii/AbiGii toxin family protein [Pseudomonadota bacterium]
MGFFYENVLTALINDGVRFVVVGGTAVILHGVPRTTADLDLVIDFETDNVQKLVDALTRLGFRPRAPVLASQLVDPDRRREWYEQKGMRAFSFQQPDHPLEVVDILIDTQINYDYLIKDAERIDAGQFNIMIASLQNLIQMKQGTGRTQDEADIDALRRLMEALKDG